MKHKSLSIASKTIVPVMVLLILVVSILIMSTTNTIKKSWHQNDQKKSPDDIESLWKTKAFQKEHYFYIWCQVIANQQFEDAVNYLALCNKTVSTIKGVVRTDKQDYPEEAIREALLNALVHRDYSFSGSIIINVNDSKMEFISLGGLLPGLSTEDIRIGVSQPRNKKLAEVFHRLRLIESYGTGIRRIFKLYENCPIQPVIEVTANAFKIVLPNMNACGAVAERVPEAAEKAPVAITPQMKTVLDYLAEYGEMTDEDLQELLNIKKTRAYLLARQMNENDLIEIIGRGAAKKYKLK